MYDVIAYVEDNKEEFGIESDDYSVYVVTVQEQIL